MTHAEIREKFLNYFKERGHAIVPSSSLLPTDPSVLFTTAGMQQFKPYYTGKADPMKDFGSLNTVSIQKSMRTSDIDEVGDESHLTFFEMLGNFSFGGYWKEAVIAWAHEFITKEMGLKIDYVSVFGGEDPSTGSGQVIPADKESELIWKTLDKKIEVKKMGRADNFWGPTGDEGPCGPTTEIYVNGVEIWNIVFNEHYQHKDKHLEPLKPAGIDTGMGLERLAMVVQGKQNIFQTDLFAVIFEKLNPNLPDRIKRIIADHARAIVFLISDGIRPSNKEQGYVLRRLIRRVITYAYRENLKSPPQEIFRTIAEEYKKIYPNLDYSVIEEVYSQEYAKFIKSVGLGLKELEKLGSIDAPLAFKLYESYGLPYETIKEEAGAKADGLTREAFDEEFRKHQEKSRAGAQKKFGGHGLLMDTGELKAGNEEELKKATRLHTATHLLHAALRKVLGPEVKQAGSDITPERLRFDFSFPRKLTPEEIRQVEDMVNGAIHKDYPVTKEEMPYEDAIKSGALAFFKLKYPNRVNVYTIGPEPVEGQPSSTSSEPPFSRELCGGPHVTHTGEIGKFRITKEESVSAGTRRIRATVGN